MKLWSSIAATSRRHKNQKQNLETFPYRQLNHYTNQTIKLKSTKMHMFQLVTKKYVLSHTAQKMNFSSFLQIQSNLLKKSLTENFTFCSVSSVLFCMKFFLFFFNFFIEDWENLYPNIPIKRILGIRMYYKQKLPQKTKVVINYPNINL